MARRRKPSATLATDLAALEELSRAEMRKRWEDFYERPPPASASRRLLLRAVAYRMQEQALGGLDRTTTRRLARAAKELAAGRPVTPSKPKIKPGTRLLREWQGTTHEVVILDRGVQYRDETWPSLSAVAREITGARWSGPRFFGLTETRGAPNGRA